MMQQGKFSTHGVPESSQIQVHLVWWPLAQEGQLDLAPMAKSLAKFVLVQSPPKSEQELVKVTLHEGFNCPEVLFVPSAQKGLVRSDIWCGTHEIYRKCRQAYCTSKAVLALDHCISLTLKRHDFFHVQSLLQYINFMYIQITIETK